MTSPSPEARAPRRVRPWDRYPVGFPIIAMGLVLAAFDAFGARYRPARYHFGVGVKPAPPIYARFVQHFEPEALIAVALVGVAGAAAAWTSRRRRIHVGVFLALAVSFMWAFGAAVALADGTQSRLVAPLERERPPDYQPDVREPRTMGVRAFVEAYPDVAPTLRSVHSKSHPPGPIVLLRWLEMLLPGSLLARAAILAFLSALILVPTWIIGARTAGERPAMYAVMLLAVSPSLVLHGWTSLDAVFATIAASALAVAALGFHERGSPRGMAAMTGFVIGLGTFMSYAMAFVAAGVGIYAFLRLPAREAIKRLILATAGGVAALALLWYVLGFDLFASYQASYEALLQYPNHRPYLFWLFGGPAAWLTFAGLPLAALGFRELLARRPALWIGVLAPLVVFYALPYSVTHLLPGELERTLSFVYPLAAVAAGAFVLRRARRLDVTIGVLVAFTAGQTLLLEVLFDYFW